MKTLKNYLAIAVLTFLLFRKTEAQELVYQVIRNGTVIGSAVITKTESEGVITYSCHSHSSTRLMFAINVDQEMQSRYANGLLLNSSLTRIVNGSVKVYNQIVWDGHRYLFSDKEGHQQYISGNITSGMTSLYFGEPSAGEQILSEGFLTMVHATRTGESTFKILLPDGHSDFFTYSDGICTRAELQTTWTTVIMKLQSNHVVQSPLVNPSVQPIKN